MTSWERAGRPKPPPIADPDYPLYAEEHGTFDVWQERSLMRWWVGNEDFKTHAEAVTYAHKLANERSAR